MEIELWDKIKTQHYVFSAENIRQIPELKAWVKETKAKLEAGELKADSRVDLEERIFELRVQMMFNGTLADPPLFYRPTPHTRMPEFMATLPYREINPFKGVRY